MSDDFLKRVPPHNLDAERAILGGILLDNEAIDHALPLIKPDDFYREHHRTIYSAMVQLSDRKIPIDVVTLTDALGGKDLLERVGGASYLADIVSFVPSASRTAHYAALVRDDSILREAAAACGRLAGEAYEAKDVEEYLANLEYETARVLSRQLQPPEPGKASVLATTLWEVEHGVDDSVLTGFPTLDRYFGGFSRGHVNTGAARTSVGKTAFALNVAVNVAKTGRRVCIFSLEQPPKENWLRMLGLVAQVDMFNARRRGYREGERERIEAARQLLQELPLEVLYRPSMRPRDLRIECRRVAREMGGLDLVVVDYFNLMRGNQHERERHREMAEAVLALKSIAGELGLPILLLSQLNRETNPNLPPSLTNLRDSGTVEEHSSNILFLWQKPLPDGAAPAIDEWQDINIIIAKQRNGPAGLSIPFQFRKSWGAFEGK